MGASALAERLFRDALATVYQDAKPDFKVQWAALAYLALAESDRDHEEAVRVTRELVRLGREHPGEREGRYLTYALMNASLVHLSAGRYRSAEELGKEALVRARELAGDGAVLARALEGMRAVYGLMGSSTEARLLAQEAADLSRASGNLERHLNDLIELSSEFVYPRSDSRAVELLDAASEIATRLGNPVSSTCSLARGYAYAGEHSRAQELLLRVLGTTSNPEEEVEVLDSLAISYVTAGAAQLAEPLLDRVLGLRRQGGDTARLKLVKVLNRCAKFAGEQGRLLKAEEYAREALTLSRRADGALGSEQCDSLRELAAVYAATGRIAESLGFLRMIIAYDERRASEVFAIGSDTQRLEFVRLLRVTTALMVSIAIQEPRVIPDALTLILRRKALAAEAVNARRNAKLSGRYPELAGELQAHRDLRLELVAESLFRARARSSAQSNDLFSQVEELERHLTRAIPDFDIMASLKRVDLDQVAAELPAGTALLEFVKVGKRDLAADSGQTVMSYVAFVLHAQAPQSVALIDLGAVEPIDMMLREYRRAVSTRARSRSFVIARANARPRRVDALLRQAVFDPLVRALGEVRQVFIAPDGELSRLPFQTLPVGRGRHLIDDYSISYLLTGRELLRPSVEPRARGTDPVVVADPAFDLQGRSGRGGYPSFSRGNHSQNSAAPALAFRRLPGARREGHLIAELLGTVVVVGDAALKARVQSLHSPSVLHLATHGFALPRLSRADNDRRRTIASSSSMFASLGALENPLLRCGLALAGANSWFSADSSDTDIGDGILNGEEAAALDLVGTELVVLSACDTGLGDLLPGEGVLGLPRAFLLAGARTVVMSMWKVPDEQTQMLMKEMYGRLLAGATRVEALRAAQLTIKAHFPDPAYWGAFVCIGAPGRMPGGEESVGSTSFTPGFSRSPTPLQRARATHDVEGYAGPNGGPVVRSAPHRPRPTPTGAACMKGTLRRISPTRSRLTRHRRSRAPRG